MPVDSNEIATRLMTEVLDPLIKNFRAMSLVVMISLPLDIVIIFVLLKFFMNDTNAAILLVACGILVVISFIQTIVFRTILVRRARGASELFMQLFPPGTEQNLIAMNMMTEMDSPAAKVLIKEIKRIENSENPAPSVILIPEVDANLPVSEHGDHGKEELIDLDSVK